MIVIFLVACLFAIPIFTLEIAKTGKCYRDIITSLLISRQDCQVDYKALFNTLRVHELAWNSLGLQKINPRTDKIHLGDTGLPLRLWVKGIVLRIDSAVSGDGHGVQMMVAQPLQFWLVSI
jgi:hypothetical protein